MRPYCTVSGTGYLISARLVEENGGWPFHLLTEDLQFSADCAARGLRIGYCDKAVIYDEQPTRFMDRSALRRDTVSVIYQDFNLFPLLTAEENVCYPLRLRKEDKDQALALARQRLADMGIRESYFRKLPNQLSGGEQQRVAIARALAAGSYVILADEPTGNLDSGNSRMIVETLQRLAHQEKRCVIVVTHDPAVAAAADVQLRMQDGRLTQEEQQAEA